MGMGADNRPIPSCESCTSSVYIAVKDEYLCSKNGVVAKDYCCKKYKFDLLKKKVVKKRNLNHVFTKEDFQV